MAKLFVAAWPPPHVVEFMNALRRPPAAGVRWVPPEQWHVTLRFLGEADAREVVAALTGKEKVSAVARLGPVVRRLGRGVLCLPVDGLADLAAAVEAMTRHLGRPADPRGFTGHLTLARLGRGATCTLEGHHCRTEWDVDEISLVSSTSRPDRVEYEVLATF